MLMNFYISNSCYLLLILSYRCCVMSVNAININICELQKINLHDIVTCLLHCFVNPIALRKAKIYAILAFLSAVGLIP